jgi:recombination protein RecT
MANAIQPITQVKNTLMSEAMKQEIKMVLPPHISVDRFVRTTMTAVSRNPDLADPSKCERKSLFQAALQAAQDGLMLDGREAAIGTFSGKAQYMPMVGGILKKIRNSGELSHIDAFVVFHSDTWEYWIDEKGKHFEFKPDETIDRLAEGNPPTNVKMVVAVATTKDGSVHVMPMTVAQVEKARKVSRAAQGAAWKNWWDGMAEKTALKKLSKRLPMSSDVEEFLARMDEQETDFTRMDAAPDPESEPPQTSRMAAAVAATQADEAKPVEAEVVEPEPEPETVPPEVTNEREPGDDDPDAPIPI